MMKQRNGFAQSGATHSRGKQTNSAPSVPTPGECRRSAVLSIRIYWKDTGVQHLNLLASKKTLNPFCGTRVLDIRMQPPTVGAETNSYIVSPGGRNCKGFHKNFPLSRKRMNGEKNDKNLCIMHKWAAKEGLQFLRYIMYNRKSWIKGVQMHVGIALWGEICTEQAA